MIELINYSNRFQRVSTSDTPSADTRDTVLFTPRQKRVNRMVVCAVAAVLAATLCLVALLAHINDTTRGGARLLRVSAREEGRTAAVASENRLCSDVAVGILKKGGSAVDAAIAASLCLGVTNSFSSGIGGGAFLLIRSSNGSSSFLDARESAPSTATTDMFASNPSLAQTSGLASAIPGELKGLHLAHSLHGVLSWKQLVTPAVEIARDGWTVNRIMASRLKSNEDWILNDTDGFAVDFAVNGRVLKEGEVCKRPRYAKTLQIIADQGITPFYNGPIGASLIATIQKHNGSMTLDDLKSYTVKTSPPLTGFYHGRKVITAPVPSSGAMLLSILNIVEGFDFKAMGYSADVVHLMVEAFKFGAAQRGFLGDYSDPVYTNISAIERQIIGKDLAALIRHNISLDRTFDVDHYKPVFGVKEDDGTMHVSILHKDTSAVSLTSTINLVFGSKIMDPETGIILNNEMDDFSIPGVPNAFGLEPSPYNYIHKGKRPMSSMVPTIIEKDGVPELIIGGSGGSKIPTGVIAAILYMLDFGLSVDEAIDMPRFHHQLVPNFVQVENAFSGAVAKALEGKGHVIERLRPDQKFVGVSAVWRIGELLTAASDSRKGGGAACF